MWMRLLLLVAGGAAAWGLARWNPPHLPLCTFQRLTGRPCPGCGMTRSMMALTHGDLLRSLRMHPLGVVLAACAAATVVGTVVGLVRGDDPVRSFLARRGFALTMAFVAALAVQWVLRAFVVPAWAPDPIGGPWGASFEVR
jgi:hypothetical protein